jgi:hypothetical protein
VVEVRHHAARRQDRHRQTYSYSGAALMREQKAEPPESITIDWTDVALINRRQTISHDDRYRPVAGDVVSEPPIIIDRKADLKTQRKFYEQMLRIPWLAPKVGEAIMRESGISVSAEKAKAKQLLIYKARLLIDQEKEWMDREKKWMRARGKRPELRPKDGIRSRHDLVVDRVAKLMGLSSGSVLKQRMRRAKQPKKRSH